MSNGTALTKTICLVGNSRACEQFVACHKLTPDSYVTCYGITDVQRIHGWQLSDLLILDQYVPHVVIANLQSQLRLKSALEALGRPVTLPDHAQWLKLPS